MSVKKRLTGKDEEEIKFTVTVDWEDLSHEDLFSEHLTSDVRASIKFQTEVELDASIQLGISPTSADIIISNEGEDYNAWTGRNPAGGGQDLWAVRREDVNHLRSRQDIPGVHVVDFTIKAGTFRMLEENAATDWFCRLEMRRVRKNGFFFFLR